MPSKISVEGVKPAVDSDRPVEAHEVRQELIRILGSSEFRASTRRRQMLEYLVEESLAGRSHALKGYSIGVSVFKRGDDFDAQTDPVVRLEARRLRRDLASYYVSEGQDNALRISIPKGHYAPQISRNVPAAAPEHRDSRSRPGIGLVPSSEPVGDKPSAAGRPSVRQSNFAKSPLLIAGGFMATCLLVLAAVWAFPWRQSVGDYAATQEPSVMVFPLVATGDSERDFALAQGLADQIVTELSRFSDIRVYLPSGGSQSVRDANPITVAKEIGVSFVLTGRVDSDGSSIKITSRLVDVPTGRVTWVRDFHRTNAIEPLLMVQDEVANEISTALGQPYGIIKNQISGNLPDDFRPSMPSYECVLRSFTYRRTFSGKRNAPVLECLKAAVKRDPQYADAWAMLGWLYMDTGRFNLTTDIKRAYDQGLDAASHALVLDGNNILAFSALASINYYMGNYEEAEQFQRKALELNPNDPELLAQFGWRLAARGNFDEGIPYLQRAIDRTVNSPAWYYHLIAIDHYLHGRYVEMLSVAKTGAIVESGASWSFIAIAYGALGDEPAAREALAHMARVAPQLARDPAAFYRRHGAIESTISKLMDGLRNAGWKAPVDS